MALPPAARRAADEATKILRDRQPARQDGAPGGNGGHPPKDDDPVAKLKTELDAERVARKEAEQKFSSLQGKYNAEVPTFQRQLAELSKTVETLEKAQPKPEPADILTEDERARTGEEIIAVATKIADHRVTEALKPVTERIEQFASHSKIAYYDILDTRVPGWEKIDNDPLFAAWLREVDPGTSQVRGALLKDAEAKQQGYRVSEIFLAYLDKREIGQAKQPASGLEKHIEHGPGQGEQQRGSDGELKRIWSGADRKRFYHEIQQGLWKGRDAERRITEQDIIDAIREGRVTP